MVKTFVFAVDKDLVTPFAIVFHIRKYEKEDEEVFPTELSYFFENWMIIVLVPNNLALDM
jgi:hypothetical protein